MRPHFIRVGAHKYDVVYSTEELALVGLREKATLLGHTDHWGLMITIHSDLSHTVERETLLHEVIHCIWTVSGVSSLKSITEEQMVRGVEHVFFQVLTNNPIFLKYLLDKEK